MTSEIYQAIRNILTANDKSFDNNDVDEFMKNVEFKISFGEQEAYQIVDDKVETIKKDGMSFCYRFKDRRVGLKWN